MKRLLHVALLLCLTAVPALAQTGTPQTKTLLNTETATNFPDNTSGAITPAIARQSFVDYIASWQQAARVNAQTGTTYTISVDDYGKLVTFSNGSPVAVTLPQATTTFSVFSFYACNKGAGAVTITPTISTINGAATFVLNNTQCAFIVSDAVNYQATPVPLTGMSNGTGTTCSVTAANGSCSLSAARQTLPTTQVFNSGSGTYTTPSNVLWIEITLIGGGGAGGSAGGAGGAGNAGGNTCWNTTGAACTTPVYQAGGGSGGTPNGGTTGGAGGTVAGSGTCVWGVAGGGGNASVTSGTSVGGGIGGNSSRGGGGKSELNNPGVAGAANSGGGGSGGGNTGGGTVGQGGGAGATCYVIIGTPAATYTYAVGAGGTTGAAGTNVGGAGGAGAILVVEHYGS